MKTRQQFTKSNEEFKAKHNKLYNNAEIRLHHVKTTGTCNVLAKQIEFCQSLDEEDNLNQSSTIKSYNNNENDNSEVWHLWYWPQVLMTEPQKIIDYKVQQDEFWGVELSSCIMIIRIITIVFVLTR